MAHRLLRVRLRSLLCLFVVAAAAVACLTTGASSRRQAKRIDYDALEKAWEAGDARQELQSTGDEQFASLADKSEDDAKALGPQMVFVSLHHAAQRREALADVAARWKESLWNGGLDVTVYEIDEGEKLLVGLQRGAQVDDLRRFLLAQPEVREIEWNSKTFTGATTHRKTHKTHKKHKHKNKHKKRMDAQARTETTPAPSPTATTRPVVAKTEL